MSENLSSSNIPVSSASTETFRPKPIAAVRDSKGALSTATNPTGGIASGLLTDDHRLTVRGVEMTLKQAVKLGAVTKNADGSYTDSDFEAAEKARTDTAEKADAEALEKLPTPRLAKRSRPSGRG